MNKHYSWQIFNGFYLKIIAFVLMTIDHVGLFMEMNGAALEVAGVFRIIGRLAFPLFVFLMVEGIRHTKCYWKYALRMGIVAIAVLITTVVIYYCFDSSMIAYSPLIDLLVCSCLLYLLKRKDKWTALIVLPLAYLALSFTTDVIEIKDHITILWFPFYLRAGYSLWGLVLSLGFYFATPLARIFLKSSDSTSAFTDTEVERNVINILSTFFLFLGALAMYLLSFAPACNLFYGEIIMWATLSGAFIMLYNGERGYNKKWFQYGSYLYFPLHLVVIFLIFFIIFR